MATEIAKAYVQIIPTTKGIKSELESELGAAGESAGKSTGSKFSSALSSGISGAAKTVAAVGAAAAAATAAVGASVAKSVMSTASLGDEIDKMSQKMGMSAESYQEWDFVLQHAGTSIEAMKSGMKTLASAAETGSDAFDKLGLSQEAIQGMSQEELFSSTIEALQNLDDETERTYLAGKLLGKGATELGALFNMSVEDVDAMKKQVHDLGGVMSDEAVKASADFADSMQNLKTAFSGISRNMAADLIPGVVTVMNGLTDVFSGNGSGVEKIKEGIASISDSIQETLPKVIETLGGIAESLVPVIGDVVTMLVEQIPTITTTLLPPLLDAITGIITSIVEVIPEILPVLIDAIISFVTTSIPQIITAGITLFASLVEALPEAITQIVAAIPQIITNILDAIISSLPQIIEAGVNLFVSLITALPQIIETIVTAVPQIISKLVESFKGKWGDIKQSGIDMFEKLKDGILQLKEKLVGVAQELIAKLKKAIIDKISQVKDIGKNIVDGVWNGIKGAYQTFYNNVSGFFKGIVDSVKSLLGIHSPSKVFAEIGGYMAQGLDVGFADEMGDVRKGIKSEMADMVSSVSDINATATLHAMPVQSDSVSLDATLSRLVNAINSREVVNRVYLDGREITASQNRANRMYGKTLQTV